MINEEIIMNRTLKVLQNILILREVNNLPTRLLDTVIKTLSRNTYEYITGGLEYMGNRFITAIKDEMAGLNGGDMAKLKTFDGNYIIGLDRINRKLWINENTGNFICQFKIYDSIDREILNIGFSESFAFILLDKLNQYVEFSQKDLVIPIESGNTNLASYQFRICRSNVDPLVNDFIILQYDNINNILIPRIVTSLSDELIGELMFMIYFSYLIDIDTGDISLMESIYSRLLE